MKHILATIMVLCLCIAFCDAQALREILPSDSIVNQDSVLSNNVVKLDSLKRIYYRRVYERIHDISNHLNYIVSPERKSGDRKYYALLLQNRFHPEARIIVKNNTNVQRYSLHNYIKQLSTSLSNDISIIRIDSITTPRWNPLAIANDTLGMVVSEQEMIPLRTGRYFENGKKGLPIIREETEDGDEWTPMLFGDMIITITYKNEKNRKNNRSNLDVICDKLR